MTLPLVSVTIICYNQEKYIAQCIESVLSQITDFYYEIVIGDDGSTDGTKEIISEYAGKYPQIKFINRPVNIGLQNNIVDVISKCSGEYISLLEGDDYWTNNNKLQIQADFLKNNNNCSVCFTNCFVFEDGFYEQGYDWFGPKSKKPPPSLFNLEDFHSLSIAIPNNTKMFRKSVMPDVIPPLFYDTIHWDYLLHIFNGLKGDFAYIPEMTLAYRRHPDAIISYKNTERLSLNGMNLMYSLGKILPEEYRKYYIHPIIQMNTLAFYYLHSRQYGKFLKWYLKWFRYTPFKKMNFRDEFYKFRENVRNK
jgi:glycosyltransferase involved in cell wall biosynthesis